MTPGLDGKNIELVRRLREADANRAECTANAGPHTILGEAANAIEDLANRLDAMWREHRWCSKNVWDR